MGLVAQFEDLSPLGGQISTGVWRAHGLVGNLQEVHTFQSNLGIKTWSWIHLPNEMLNIWSQHFFHVHIWATGSVLKKKKIHPSRFLFLIIRHQQVRVCVSTGCMLCCSNFIKVLSYEHNSFISLTCTLKPQSRALLSPFFLLIVSTFALCQGKLSALLLTF